MKRILPFASVGFQTAILLYAGSDADDKLEAKIRRESANLEKLSAVRVTPERALLHKYAAAFIDTARQERANRYRADRYVEAAEDLLEASESLDDLNKPPRSNGDDGEREQRQKAARRLERAYFRLQQAEYFGKQSANPATAELISVARKHYQQSRSAYDEKRYRRSDKLADVCFDVVNALEKLAQAQVRIPEPPRLPEPRQ